METNWFDRLQTKIPVNTYGFFLAISFVLLFIAPIILSAYSEDGNSIDINFWMILISFIIVGEVTLFIVNKYTNNYFDNFYEALGVKALFIIVFPLGFAFLIGISPLLLLCWINYQIYKKKGKR